MGLVTPLIRPIILPTHKESGVHCYKPKPRRFNGLPLDKMLQALPIVDPVLERTLCLITLKGNSLSPAALELSALIVDRFRDALGSDPA